MLVSAIDQKFYFDCFDYKGGFYANHRATFAYDAP